MKAPVAKFGAWRPGRGWLRSYSQSVLPHLCFRQLGDPGKLATVTFLPGFTSRLPPTPLSPILLGFTFDRWRRRMLGLDPVLGTVGAAGRTEALAHDALEAEFAGVLSGQGGLRTVGCCRPTNANLGAPGGLRWPSAGKPRDANRSWAQACERACLS
jgi:hypothetical protein